MERIPVFFVDGFLDSGKTSFIADLIKRDTQDYNVRTLLIVCEQGEVEYDETFLKKTLTTIKYIENEEDFDYKAVGEWVRESNPDRVIVEMNGMWDLSKLQFPRILSLAQFVTMVDMTTFPIYYNNMRQKITDLFKRSHLVCFTRVENPEDLAPYQTQFKLINNNAAYFIMDKEYRAMPAFEEELPYDVEAPVIEIQEKDYGVFYTDTFDHKERYDGKTVDFYAHVVKSSKLPKGAFIAGRFIMNCCANDIQLFGFFCKSDLGMNLKDRQSVRIKAKVAYEYSEQYEEEELVMTPIEITPLGYKLDEVLNLTN